ncbi:MAG: efflux RND transporter permease subunit [Verrucomicrobia bacterium]|nr:efflux RND transporter permease subunit [Verrucomicrobiota bacterium]MBI3871085.1 efflux RND transporter permease subunit [Verrucomicrobiota bacterium]
MVISKLSIERPVLASMLNLALILFGVIGLTRLPVRELPDIDPPIVSVTTVYPGANAQVVETEVTERLEEAINNIEGIKTLTSESREQASLITIEFNLSRDIDLAAQDVRDRVSRVRGALPLDVREPIVAKQDADANAIIWISLYSDRYSTLELTTLAERQIKPRFQTVQGVSSIIIGGEKRFAMRLWLDSEKMAARQVTVLDVQRSLRQQNVELPSGRVENLDREMTIQTRGEMKTADEFNNLVVRATGSTLVRLRDIGRAEAGAEDYRTIARSNGKPCVFLGIVKQSKANTVTVAKGVHSEIAAIKSTLPMGVDIFAGYDESTYVEQAISEVWETLAIAFGLVLIIIFVFLRNFRSTLIPTVAIPVSILGAFGVLYWMGYSINILTMLALVLAIGVVVDDAIVVLEAIYRYVELGMPPREAAFKAMEEISVAIISITLSLVAVFLPLAFQRGQTGRLFIEFAFAMAGSVVLSAFVALTLSPAMAARMLKPVSTEKHGFLFRFFESGLNAVSRAYAALLRLALGHRGLTVVVALLSLVATFAAYRALDKDFLPEEDKGRLFCMMFTPNGSTSEFTDRQLQKMERMMQATPEVESFASMVAPGMAGPGQANFALLFVTLKSGPRKSVQRLVNDPGGLRGQFLSGVEGGLAIPNIPKAIGRSLAAPFELILQNQDLDALAKTSAELANKLRGKRNLENVRVSFELNKPELRLDIDRQRAASLGVTIEDISRTVQILFGGLDLSRLKTGGKEYNVIAQLDRKSRLTPQDLDNVYVRSATGELIQLSAVVARTSGATANAINHFGRLRSATISASPVGTPLGTVIAETEEMLREELPAGFLFTWGSEARDLNEANRDVWWILGLAAVIIYMTLAAQFESLVHPLTVMLALPLAGVGAFGLIWLLNVLGKMGVIPVIPAMNFNLFSQVGLVLLLGLVTKNSILLVEYANQQVTKGRSAHDAMTEAGLVRLRPILMTALCTIAGILPIAVGFGAGAESRRPMGVAVIGGMLTSTFLTLFIVPVIYTLFSDLTNRVLRRKAPSR